MPDHLILETKLRRIFGIPYWFVALFVVPFVAGIIMVAQGTYFVIAHPHPLWTDPLLLMSIPFFVLAFIVLGLTIRDGRRLALKDRDTAIRIKAPMKSK